VALLEVRDLVKHFPIRKGVFYRHVGDVNVGGVMARPNLGGHVDQGRHLGIHKFQGYAYLEVRFGVPLAVRIDLDARPAVDREVQDGGDQSGCRVGRPGGHGDTEPLNTKNFVVDHAVAFKADKLNEVSKSRPVGCGCHNHATDVFCLNG
jgi:hypothetical protein